eukprot:1962376-Alexandrium_andersonii.AAC.1
MYPVPRRAISEVPTLITPPSGAEAKSGSLFWFQAADWRATKGPSWPSCLGSGSAFSSLRGRL